VTKYCRIRRANACFTTLLCRSRTRSSSVVTLARPSVSSLLHINNRFFHMHHLRPYLWNQLPSSFRLLHPVHSLPGSPHLVHYHLIIIVPMSSLSPPVTPSIFNPDLQLICSTNPFLYSLSGSTRTAFTDFRQERLDQLLGTGVCLFLSFSVILFVSGYVY